MEVGAENMAMSAVRKFLSKRRRTAQRQRRHSLLLIFSLLCATAALGITGYLQYRRSQPIYPQVLFSGGIDISIPNDSARVDIQVVWQEVILRSQEPHLEIFIKLTFASNQVGCKPIGVNLKKDALMTTIGSIWDDTVELREEFPEVSERRYRVQACRVDEDGFALTGLKKNQLAARISGLPGRSMFNRSGYIKTIQGPLVYVERKNPKLEPIKQSIEYDLGGLPDQSRVEFASVNWTQAGLLFNNRGAQPPSITLVNIPGEQAAQQSLFWAGIFVGAAVSVLAWVGEIALDYRRNAVGASSAQRRRRQPPRRNQRRPPPILRVGIRKKRIAQALRQAGAAQSTRRHTSNQALQRVIKVAGSKIMRIENYIHNKIFPRKGSPP